MRPAGRLCNLLFWGNASLSAQVLGDAAPLGGGVTSYVQKLRVAENATDEEIKIALHQLFSYSPQGPSSRQDQLAPQGQSVLSYPQGTNSV